jgi:hypothetical protein
VPAGQLPRIARPGWRRTTSACVRRCRRAPMSQETRLQRVIWHRGGVCLQLAVCRRAPLKQAPTTGARPAHVDDKAVAHTGARSDSSTPGPAARNKACGHAEDDEEKGNSTNDAAVAVAKQQVQKAVEQLPEVAAEL